MKKKKRTYSLTAKERKALRRKETNKLANDGSEAQSDIGVSSLASAENEMLAKQRITRRSAIIIGAVVAVAIVLILVGMIAPAIMIVANPYRGYSDVIARFKLSNGMTLEYVIEEDTYDIAATNFIFLAKNGFFDNTVFFDAQKGWLRFGGYEDQPASSTVSSSDYSRTLHHINNQAFCESFTAIPDSRVETWKDKFGYRLRADTNGTNATLLQEKGLLTFLYSETSTEFQFSYTEQASNQISRRDSTGKEYVDTLSCTKVGYTLNETTLENIVAIAKTARVNSAISIGYLWEPPTPNIYIDSVKVYNLDSSKWRNFDFVKYMRSEDSSGRERLSGWVGQI